MSIPGSAATDKEILPHLTGRPYYLKPVSIRLDRLKPIQASPLNADGKLQQVQLGDPDTVPVSGTTRRHQQLLKETEEEKLQLRHTEKIFPELKEAPNAADFSKPKCHLTVLVVLVLLNSENRAFTYYDIMKIISLLFPHYNDGWETCGKKTWKSRLYSATASEYYSDFFMKIRNKGKSLIMLNPANEFGWRKYVQDGMGELMEEARLFMNQPELLRTLVQGGAILDHWLSSRPPHLQIFSDSSNIIPEAASQNDSEDDISPCVDNRKDNCQERENVSPNRGENSVSNKTVAQLQEKISESNNKQAGFIIQSATHIEHPSSHDEPPLKKQKEFQESENVIMPANTAYIVEEEEEKSKQTAVDVHTLNNNVIACSSEVSGSKDSAESSKSEKISVFNREPKPNFCKQKKKRKKKAGVAQMQMMMKFAAMDSNRNGVGNHNKQPQVVSCGISNPVSRKELNNLSLAPHNVSRDKFTGRPETEAASCRKNKEVQREGNTGKPQTEAASCRKDKQVQTQRNTGQPQTEAASCRNDKQVQTQRNTGKPQTEAASCRKNEKVQKQRNTGKPQKEAAICRKDEDVQTKRKEPSKFISFIDLADDDSSPPQTQLNASVSPVAIPATSFVETPDVIVIDDDNASPETTSDTSKVAVSQSQMQHEQNTNIVNDLVDPTENDESSLKIVCVEDRAYHMWLPESTDMSRSNTTSVSMSSRTAQVDDEALQIISDTTTLGTPTVPFEQHISIPSSVSDVPPTPFNSSSVASTCPETQRVMTASAQQQTVHSISRLQPLQSSQTKPTTKSVPKVASCIDAWKRVFPWMIYVESTNVFSCNVCEWGSINEGQYLVFKLVNLEGVYSVAGQLRVHDNSTTHKALNEKKKVVTLLFSTLYPILKRRMPDVNSLQDLVSMTTASAGGKFPGPYNSPLKEHFLSYMIIHTAQCVSDTLFTFLRSCVLFSVVAVEEKDYAIVRWVNSDGKTEEHFFHVPALWRGERLSSLEYIAKQNVDMSKLVSYCNFPGMAMLPNPRMPVNTLLRAPVRIPPVELLLRWLKTFTVFGVFFSHLNTLTTLVKDHESMFSNSISKSGIKEFLNTLRLEPASERCILYLNAVTFFFENVEVVSDICKKIYLRTGKVEARIFSNVDKTLFDAIKRCIFIVPKINDILYKESGGFEEKCRLLQELRSHVSQLLKNGTDDAEYNIFPALTLIDIYLSHVILIMRSPGRKFIQVYLKKLKNLTVKDFQVLKVVLDIKDNTGCEWYFTNLIAQCNQLSIDKENTLLQVINILMRSNIQMMHKTVVQLCMKTSALPFIFSTIEQHMFSIAAIEMFMSNRFDRRLVPHLAVVMLEGPDVEKINVEFVLYHWSQRWKNSQRTEIRE